MKKKYTIKPLVWKKQLNGHYYARSSFGEMEIRRDSYYTSRFELIAPGGRNFDVYRTIAEAKESAEIRHKERVEEWLEEIE